MRIGIYDPYLDTMSGGEKYMLSIARCLAKNHTVSLFWDPKKKNEIVEKAKHRFDFDISRLSFVPSIFSSSVPFIERFLASRRYDRIIILSDGSLPFLSCPTIVHFQSPVQWVRSRLKTKIKVSRLHSIVCNSKFTKGYIDSKFGVNSRVVYPPIILQEKKGLEKRSTILNVGRFGINHSGSSYKKQEVLIDTFKEMIKRGNKGWELVLVMSVRDEDKEKLVELQDTAKTYPIRFVINPENDHLWEEYEKAEIYWHASGFGEDLTLHPDRAEHFGMSTVEAMGMGAIPIVINAGGQKEIVQHGKNGYLWNTKEELIDLTSRVMNDHQIRKNLKKEAIISSEKFSIESFCKQFSDLV